MSVDIEVLLQKQKEYWRARYFRIGVGTPRRRVVDRIPYDEINCDNDLRYLVSQKRKTMERW